MIWKTKLTAVNLNTGEQIFGIGKEIKKHYTILSATRKTNYINTEYGEIEITWECIPRPEQLKLF